MAEQTTEKRAVWAIVVLIPLLVGSGIALFKALLPGAGAPKTAAPALPSDPTSKIPGRSFVAGDVALSPIVDAPHTYLPPPDADEPTPIESWSEGRVKVLAREWSADGHAIEEHCFFAFAGEKLGCGILRDGQRWEGIFVDWAQPIGPDRAVARIVREVGAYRDGQRHGVSHTFRADGSPMVEARYESGRQLSKRIFQVGGNELLELGKKVTGIPASQRKRNTSDAD